MKKNKCENFFNAMLSISIGKFLIVEIINCYVECDNIDDAYCIINQLEGEELEK